MPEMARFGFILEGIMHIPGINTSERFLPTLGLYTGKRHLSDGNITVYRVVKRLILSRKGGYLLPWVGVYIYHPEVHGGVFSACFCH